jgi:hypothetical protein
VLDGATDFLLAGQRRLAAARPAPVLIQEAHMDSAHFDRLTRIVSIALSRRTTLVALAGGFFGAGSLAPWDDAVAKKKRRRKKKRKKKCKGSTKKCGKKCIPTSGCCSSADCDEGRTCVSGTCTCPSGLKECNGECIPESQCCGACPGDTFCDGGECVCPEFAPHECPGGECLSPGNCCETSQCPEPKECIDEICLCPGTEAINCSATLCCDGAADEVCKLVPGNPATASCQGGGCPATDFCSDLASEQFVCASDPDHVCVCTSTVELISGEVCIDLELLLTDPCVECETSSDCGTGRVCIADGPCRDCGFNFCATLCPEVTFNHVKRGAGGAPVDLEALMGRLRKRHR